MSKTRNLKFQFGPSSKNGQFYWRIKAGNGEIVAQGEGYKSKTKAKKVFTILRDAFDHFLIIEQELDKRGKPVPSPAFVGTLVSS